MPVCLLIEIFYLFEIQSDLTAAEFLPSQSAFLEFIIKKAFRNGQSEPGLTGQAGGHVDLGVEPLVGQQLGHPVQRLHGEGVVGVGQKVDHRHRLLRQAHLLGDEADAGPARLALPAHAAPARHAVGQVRPAARVGRRRPLQDQRGLLQRVDQVSRRGRRPCGDESNKNGY